MPTLPEAPTKPVPPSVPAPATLNPKTGSSPTAQPSSGTASSGSKEKLPAAAGSEKPAVSDKTLQKPAAPDTNSTTAVPAPAEASSAAFLAPAGGGETTGTPATVPAKSKAADGLFPSTVSSWLLIAILLVGLAGLGLQFFKRKRPPQPARTVIDYSGRSKVITGDSGVEVTIAPPSNDKSKVKSHFEVRI